MADLSPILEAALAWHAAGASVVPTRNDGSKAPAAFWAQYQHERPTERQLRQWFADGQYDGLGAITGTVSGGVEMLEIEGRAQHLAAELATAMTDNGLAELWQKVTAGYLETTPSGGYHWLYRVHGGEVPGNTKIARRPSTPEEFDQHIARLRADAETDPNDDVRARRLATIDRLTPERVPQVLIETRGEGGFTVLAPSAGRTHPTGKAWTTLIGSPATLPTITLEEREALHAVAAMFDQMPADGPAENMPADIPPRPTSSDDDAGAVRPGDDYNTRTTWDDILTPHGWTRAHRLGTGYGWTRPGKNPRDGISATTGQNNDADRLYVFTTSTVFEEGRPYSKFAAYALLEHGGDYANAARELARQGYGTRRPEPGRTVDYGLDGLIAPTDQKQTVTGTDGNLATVHTIPAPDQRPIAAVTERTLERSDDANALALINRFGTHIRYVHDRGRWITWDGQRWQWAPSSGGHVRELAKRVARALPETDQPDITHKKKSLSANGITAIVTQAQTDDRITLPLGALDAHPYELNTPAGIVDLTTGHLTPADPDKLHSRMTTVAPDPAHPTPRWDAFLADTFAGHEDVLPFVQELAGYSATGAVTHHILPFLHGPGGNGKSVFLDVLRAILGDYAGAAPAKFLMAHSQQHETEIARLSGLRMVITSEVNQEDKFDEAKVKLLTGGDSLTARFMRQDHFEFEPTHHLWLMGNHQPKVTGGGESFWRRLRLIPFTNVVPPEKKIDGLAELLITEEGPGILAWILQGAVDVIRGGMHPPASVLAATDTYASEEDVLARFITDRCHVTGNDAARIDTAELRAAYTRWCDAEGEKALSPQVFGRELRTRYGVEQKRSNGRRYYVGLTLLADENEPDEPEEWWQK